MTQARDAQALIPRVSPFPPVSRVSCKSLLIVHSHPAQAGPVGNWHGIKHEVPLRVPLWNGLLPRWDRDEWKGKGDGDGV
jgi:hypothetical protein